MCLENLFNGLPNGIIDPFRAWFKVNISVIHSPIKGGESALKVERSTHADIE